jgi:hypothetical protein
MASIESATPLIFERAKTHGDFGATAEIAQAIKSVYRTGRNWDRLNDEQREALDAIATKTARILSGKPDCADHWQDCAGYVSLALLSMDGSNG